MSDAIDLYFWPTPNGWKISIALEEMALPYNVCLVDISQGEQFTPDFLSISPNNRMPAIVDPVGPEKQPISVFESGAILQYLSQKTGMFYGHTIRERIEIDQWLMWQMGGLGPMAGQAHHFLKYAPQLNPPQDLPYAKSRYRDETARLYGVLNKRLDDRDFVAGNISIADFAIWPWASLWEGQQQNIEAFPNMAAWLARMGERPGVKAGRAVAAELRSNVASTKEAQNILFGKRKL